MISDGVPLDPAHSSNFLSRLAREEDIADLARCIVEAEHVANYPRVEKLCRVITAETEAVLVDESIRDRIESGDRVSARDWQATSVQLWTNKIAQFGLQRLRGNEELFFWPHRYDPAFLGIMAGVVEDIDRFLTEPTATIF
ncbi:MAG: hypothetical protein Q8J74_08455, partial [Candidatus Didemnitutus sp.]|nr:hypothetical protein [Candidatus Didemnitutus sp.]